MTIKIKNPKNNGMLPIFSKGKQYLILDWANFVRRAYHSTEKDKVLELIIFMLSKQRKLRPDSLFVFALEGLGREIRASLLPQYKADRKVDSDFDVILNNSLKLLKFFRGMQIKAPQGEADDAIACFVKRMEKGSHAVIVSEDRDLWQLLQGDRVKVEVRKEGVVDEYKCAELLGVHPRNIACLKAFLGDSDNVPRGVPRMKTAILTELAGCGATPATAYRAAKERSILTDKQLDRVVKCKEQIDLNYKVVRLRDGLQLLTRKQKGDSMGLMQYLSSHMMHRVDVETISRLTREGPEA